MPLRITFKELEDLGCSSITDYCRLLMNQSVRFADASVEVYRGDMLCLTVTNIAEGAKLEPTGVGFAKYTLGTGLRPRRSHAKLRGCV